MTGMIERVASAMCNAAHEGDDGSAARDWNSNQSAYRDMARAAIEAMREPTEAMEDAGNVPTYQWVDQTAADVWVRMIDAALNEKEPSQ